MNDGEKDEQKIELNAFPAYDLLWIQNSRFCRFRFCASFTKLRWHLNVSKLFFLCKHGCRYERNVNAFQHIYFHPLFDDAVLWTETPKYLLKFGMTKIFAKVQPIKIVCCELKCFHHEQVTMWNRLMRYYRPMDKYEFAFMQTSNFSKRTLKIPALLSVAAVHFRMKRPRSCRFNSFVYSHHIQFLCVATNVLWVHFWREYFIISVFCVCV